MMVFSHGLSHSGTTSLSSVMLIFLFLNQNLAASVESLDLEMLYNCRAKQW